MHVDFITDIQFSDGLAGRIRVLPQNLQFVLNGLRGQLRVESSLGQLVECREVAGASKLYLGCVVREGDAWEQPFRKRQIARLAFREDFPDRQLANLRIPHRLSISIQRKNRVG